ncbi:sigma-54-dependent Fis family transcriptional regulator [Pseudoalteromonas phenolica]|uniref:Sigma-54-dependent Fis family transcriptional regulator n=1 Tax=Pseudoalteromonas phenolica TaxID=161398 RepID=A0A5S3YW57_9GAMM|nr:sigma-54 dependent transcriptional regulator [Pseudoalteromonas phenolica]TMP82290.1 sigma-54-dependent Fis family transcriptional regulator [Pseudoalteromonas phenolica]
MDSHASKSEILIVEDRADIRLSLRFLLCNHGYDVFEAENPIAASSLLETKDIDLILLDMNFEFDTTSGEEGLAFLRAQQKKSFPPILAMTAWSSVSLAVEAMQLGAKDFFAKPWDNHAVVMMVKKHLALAQIDRQETITQNESLVQRSKRDSSSDKNTKSILWHSPQMQKLKAQLERVAKTDATIFLRGENGTGKSCIAEYVHNYSERNGEFVSVNMGAIPESLFESELFGHKKGAFTDAKQDRAGRFELANNGTLFLDEVATMGPNQQAKLLRVLESKQFERVGGTHTQQASCRIITASNADLEAMLESGDFRADLYFRLNTIELTIPPLSARTEDIIVLAEHFIELHAKQYQVNPLPLSKLAENALLDYSWPGNVRELSHMMARAVLMAEGDCIGEQDLEFKVLNNSPKNVSSEDDITLMTLEDAEKKLLKMALAQTQNNVEQAGELLGISKSAIYRRLEKFGMSTK